MEQIILPIVIMGVIAIILALLLYFASEVFYVPVDPKVQAVRDALPGANCGACGFPGCDGLAEAIVAGEAPVTACPIGGEETAEEVADIMGLNAEGMVKYIAVVKCQGNKDRAKDKYMYMGSGDCRAIEANAGGNKLCPSGCLGGGSCVNACEYDAIEIVNGLAVINKDKCVACERCLDACPKHIIEMEPYDRKSLVLCSSNDKGKDVRGYCQVGCIGCRICAKQYEDGFEVDNFLAKATYEPDKADLEALNNAIDKCPNDCITSVDGTSNVVDKEKETVNS